jgi:thiosulfate/3-mercaptopyruvate sulfurtransferase
MQPQLRTTIQDLQLLPQMTSQVDAAQEALQDVLLIDTRNVQQYTGQVRRGPRGGHIPSAVSLPRAMLLDEQTECFKPLAELQQLLQAAGVVLGGEGASQQQVVLYCNGGVAACTAALALHRLGHRCWSVYDGSWNEWSRSDLPVQ